MSTGDLKDGFNQLDNEPETMQKMAVLSTPGSYLPRGLTFGPTNGPEDFQGLVFEVFARRLYKDHFIFIDDLAVATGRPRCWPAGPSQVADVLNAVQAQSRAPIGAPEAPATGCAPQEVLEAPPSHPFPMNSSEEVCLSAPSDKEDVPEADSKEKPKRKRRLKRAAAHRPRPIPQPGNS